ncbi:hypothetical protein B9L19_12700 [Geobacillus thermocatenulatus]|uniref:Uncharacterized protein n=1 Tax=Geobacillus thermocatenulatus TaxID=33938 RepID=A0AA91TCB0_9BACL|nr:hypothetical protein B9L19_12700 [Geobacillus thermocatenulatus]
MKWVFISRMTFRLKAETIFILAFSGVLMFFCLNPHTINPRGRICFCFKRRRIRCPSFSP